MGDTKNRFEAKGLSASLVAYAKYFDLKARKEVTIYSVSKKAGKAEELGEEKGAVAKGKGKDGSIHKCGQRCLHCKSSVKIQDGEVNQEAALQCISLLWHTKGRCRLWSCLSLRHGWSRDGRRFGGPG